MERAYRTETVVDAEGTVRLRDVPFGPGEVVEVILLVRPRADLPNTGARSLRGSVRRYDDPTEPVAADDWELAE